MTIESCDSFSRTNVNLITSDYMIKLSICVVTVHQTYIAHVIQYIKQEIEHLYKCCTRNIIYFVYTENQFMFLPGGLVCVHIILHPNALASRPNGHRCRP